MRIRFERGLFFATVAVALAAGARGDDPAPQPAAPRPVFHARLLLSDLEPLTDREARKAEVFYAAATGAYENRRWGARVEVRGTDGRFRPYFPGSVWVEEGYGFVRTSVGEIRVGKLERAFGLRDETFEGTLFSANGVTRNPDFGAGLSGEKRLGWDELRWDLRYFGQNDHVAWEEDGRGVESDPGAKLRDDVELRVSYTWSPGFVHVRPELSAATARVARAAAAPDVFRRDLALSLTATIGPPLSLTIQGFWRSAEAQDPASPTPRLAYDGATATLVEVRSEFPNVVYRYVYSEWRYHGADASETLHQPEVAWSPVTGIQGLVAFSARRFHGPTLVKTSNAFRFGLTLSF